MADGRLLRVRLKFERDFTQIPNEWLRDRTLSLRARGLLALLMSHDDGFTVTYKSLAATNPEGVTALSAAADELKQHGYLEVVKQRGRYGRIEGWVWALTDPAERKARSTPQLDIPNLAEPNLAEPHTGDRVLKEAHSEEHLPRDTQDDQRTRAGVEDDALTGDDSRVATPSPEALYERLLHQPCPFRTGGGEHVWTGREATCAHCGIRPTSRWYRGDIAPLEDVARLIGAVA